MNRIIYLNWLVLIVCSTSFAAESDPYEISKLSFKDCAFQTVKNQLWMQSMKNEAEIAKNTIKVMEEFKKIAGKAPNTTQPIGEQLNPSDLSRFGELRNQNIQLSTASLTESKRKRDLDFIERAVILADSMYRFGELPKDESDKKILAIVIQTLQFNDNSLKVSVPDKKECSLDMALARLEDEPLSKLNQLDDKNQSAEVLNYLNYLVKKYKTPSVDVSKLNTEELTKYNSYVKSYIKPASDLEEQIKFFEMLKAFEKASEIMYTSRKQDAMYGSENVSKTYSKNADAGLYDAVTTSAIKALIYIDKVIPSDTEKELIDISKVIQKSNKNNAPAKNKKKVS